MAYVPSPIPYDIEQKYPELAIWIRQELSDLDRSQNDARESFNMKVLGAPPDRAEPGRVYYANGTTWNPGAGEGVYRFNIAGTFTLVG
jgi:hypothetical protein